MYLFKFITYLNQQTTNKKQPRVVLFCFILKILFIFDVLCGFTSWTVPPQLPCHSFSSKEEGGKKLRKRCHKLRTRSHNQNRLSIENECNLLAIADRPYKPLLPTHPLLPSHCEYCMGIQVFICVFSISPGISLGILVNLLKADQFIEWLIQS